MPGLPSVGGKKSVSSLWMDGLSTPGQVISPQLQTQRVEFVCEVCPCLGVNWSMRRVDLVQNKLGTRNLSTSRRLARRTDHLRSFFVRVITHHTHAHTPRWFCGRSRTMSSITSPQTCFVGPLRKTRPWPRARAKRPCPTLVLSQSLIYVSIQLPAEWLGVWGPFGCLSLPSGSEMGRSTAKIGVSSHPWSFSGTRAAPVAR